MKKLIIVLVIVVLVWNFAPHTIVIPGGSPPGISAATYYHGFAFLPISVYEHTWGEYIRGGPCMVVWGYWRGYRYGGFSYPGSGGVAPYFIETEPSWAILLQPLGCRQGGFYAPNWVQG